MKTILSIIVAIIVTINITSSAFASNTIHWYWMSPNIFNSQTEVIRYDVVLSESWVDDVHRINNEISMSAINNRFSNLEQLEGIINEFLKKEHVGKNFHITDVQRVDVLNPKELLK